MSTEDVFCRPCLFKACLMDGCTCDCHIGLDLEEPLGDSAEEEFAVSILYGFSF